MSRLHRAVEKAEREGLLTWTRPLEQHRRQADAANETAMSGTAFDGPEAAGPADPLASAPPPAWETLADGDAMSDFVESRFSPLLVAATEPASPAAEQYRLLQTRLDHDPHRKIQVLLVTSPRLGDGKTTTSANLALTMAREFRHKVVLVEADLRRPTLAAQFGLPTDRGLVDVLVGGLSLEDALVTVPGHQLTLLPAGAEAVRSTELLASSMMQRVLEALRTRFDHIVVDTTPVALADTHVLARMADGVLVVVRAGITPRPALERALTAIDRDRLLGIVLNEVDETPGSYPYPGLEYRGGRRE